MVHCGICWHAFKACDGKLLLLQVVTKFIRLHTLALGQFLGGNGCSVKNNIGNCTKQIAMLVTCGVLHSGNVHPFTCVQASISKHNQTSVAVHPNHSVQTSWQKLHVQFCCWIPFLVCSPNAPTRGNLYIFARPSLYQTVSEPTPFRTFSVPKWLGSRHTNTQLSAYATMTHSLFRIALFRILTSATLTCRAHEWTPVTGPCGNEPQNHGSSS